MVLLKALEERNVITTVNGRIAIGWLIVEDLAMVLVLVLLPAFAEALGGRVVANVHAAGGQGLFVTAWPYAGQGGSVRRSRVAGRTTCAALVAASGGADRLARAVHTLRPDDRDRHCLWLGHALQCLLRAWRLSAGVVLSESELSHKAAANSLPLQDAFAVLFFVSVGMLFDPSIVWREPLMVLAVLLLILVGKSLVAMGIVLLMGYPLSTALFASASLAQIGEFSFILAGLGATYGLLPLEGINMILAGALLSTTLNPLVFRLVDGVMGFVQARPRLVRRFEEQRGERAASCKATWKRPAHRQSAAAAHKTCTPQELADRFPLFAGLTLEQRAVLLLHFKPRTAEPGERIFRAGDEADGVYFISRRGRGLDRRTADQAGAGESSERWR